MTHEHEHETILDCIYQCLMIVAAGFVVWSLAEQAGLNSKVKDYFAELARQAKEEATARRLVREVFDE